LQGQPTFVEFREERVKIPAAYREAKELGALNHNFSERSAAKRRTKIA
jgi:hypothetical protein